MKRKTIRLAQEGRRRIKMNLKGKKRNKKIKAKPQGFNEAKICHGIEASHVIHEGMVTQMSNQFGFSFSHGGGVPQNLSRRPGAGRSQL